MSTEAVSLYRETMALFTKPVFRQQKQQHRQKERRRKKSERNIDILTARYCIYLFEYFCYTSRIFGMFGFGFSLEMTAAAMYVRYR